MTATLCNMNAEQNSPNFQYFYLNTVQIPTCMKTYHTQKQTSDTRSQTEYKITIFQDVRECRKVDNGGPQTFQTPTSHLHILGTERVTRRKFPTEDPQF